MNEPIQTMLLLASLTAVGLMALLWIVMQLRFANAAIVDVGWGMNLALIAAVYAVEGPGYEPRKWLLAGMGMVWGVRLAVHLFVDRIWRKPEEGRYQELRRSWKTSLALKFFLFYQLQAGLGILLSIVFLIPALNPEPRISGIEWLAAGLWLLAFAGEWLADWQLAAFKADAANQGKTCRAGLWKYSRHPNYFFEWLVWMAYALLALASPWGWLATLAPALMLYFLFKVTGIPATEAQALRSRGEAYRRYQETTSVFVPWFPRGPE